MRYIWFILISLFVLATIPACATITRSTNGIEPYIMYYDSEPWVWTDNNKKWSPFNYLGQIFLATNLVAAEDGKIVASPTIPSTEVNWIIIPFTQPTNQIPEDYHIITWQVQMRAMKIPTQTFGALQIDVWYGDGLVGLSQVYSFPASGSGTYHTFTWTGLNIPRSAWNSELLKIRIKCVPPYPGATYNTQHFIDQLSMSVVCAAD